MEDANDIVIEALAVVQGVGAVDRLPAIETEFATVEQERARLVAAIASGGQLDGLLRALQAREARRTQLETERATVRAQRPLQASETDRVRDELLTLVGSWRRALADDPTHTRPMVSSLLKGRVTFTPTAEPRQWTLQGQGTIEGLSMRALPRGMASPICTSWNQLYLWIRALDGLRKVA